MRLLEGKTLNLEIMNGLLPKIEIIKEKLKRPPSLRIVNYYEDSASGVYMNMKIKACKKLGIDVLAIKPDLNAPKETLLNLMKELSQDDNVDAVMIERPLPEGFDNMAFWDSIDAGKDVDCLSSVNNGRLYINKDIKEMVSGSFFVPCTALAVIKILNHYSINVAGKNVAVIGRSAVVGKPLAHMLSSMNATVSLCHSKTTDIETYIKNSQVVFLAIGKAKWLKKEMLSKGQIVIDVGTNFDENGKMCGDADFEEIKDFTDAITPVPGGVGPVTLACLIEASVNAAFKKAEGL